MIFSLACFRVIALADFGAGLTGDSARIFFAGGLAAGFLRVVFRAAGFFLAGAFFALGFDLVVFVFFSFVFFFVIFAQVSGLTPHPSPSRFQMAVFQHFIKVLDDCALLSVVQFQNVLQAPGQVGNIEQHMFAFPCHFSLTLSLV